MKATTTKMTTVTMNYHIICIKKCKYQGEYTTVGLFGLRMLILILIMINLLQMSDRPLAASMNVPVDVPLTVKISQVREMVHFLWCVNKTIHFDVYSSHLSRCVTFVSIISIYCHSTLHATYVSVFTAE